MDSIDDVILKTDGTGSSPRFTVTVVSESSAKTVEKTVVGGGFGPLFWRLYDIICSTVALVILLPFLAVIFVLIKKETSASAIAVSERSSPKSNKFSAFNFRCSTLIDGKRVPTRIGNVLHGTGMDQLPLLFNVLMGDISLGEAFQISRLHRRTVDGTYADYTIVSDLQWFGTELKTKYPSGGSSFFWATKRLFDIVASLVLLPVLGVAAITLMALNPFWNKGPLFYTQKRMGRYNQPFAIYKFRTMVGQGNSSKFATEEKFRILKFGAFIRDKRIDELPQILNVLKGEMSLVGPRPEQVMFVTEYSSTITNYDIRHSVRPGISGLAQVEIGYTSDIEKTKKKLKYDLKYIAQVGFKLEAYTIWRTLVTIITGFGAK